MKYIEDSAQISGYVAATLFLLFAGVGALAQVIKLYQRQLRYRQGSLPRSEVCAGLHSTREVWSYSAFLLFALSGVTRSYFDGFLVFSRLPVVICSTIILGFLAAHVGGRARTFFICTLLGDLLLVAGIIAVASGAPINRGVIPLAVDAALSMVSVLLFYGKSVQAIQMYRQSRSGAVSYTREIGLVLKDISGLWYALTVGAELRWVALTHLLSLFSSSAIVFVKNRVECRSAETSEQGVKS